MQFIPSSIVHCLEVGSFCYVIYGCLSVSTYLIPLIGLGDRLVCPFGSRYSDFSWYSLAHLILVQRLGYEQMRSRWHREGIEKVWYFWFSHLLVVPSFSILNVLDLKLLFCLWLCSQSANMAVASSANGMKESQVTAMKVNLGCLWVCVWYPENSCGNVITLIHIVLTHSSIFLAAVIWTTLGLTAGTRFDLDNLPVGESVVSS